MNETRKSIPYGRQNILDEDIQAVVETLKSDFLTQGPKIEEFEKAFSGYVNAKHAVAVSNGTAALHLAVLALGIKPGQKVITTPITFAASANCVLYAGGTVDFVDIDPETFLIDVDAVEKKLSQSKPGEYAGIIPVDFTGLAVNTEKLRTLADRYGLWILEDACHAVGGSFKNSNGQIVKCGDCQYVDAAAFSFHPVKHIATGEGGMVTVNRVKLKNQLLQLRSHGITKDPIQYEENHGGWYHEMQQLGYNYRLTDMQCALGLSQLKRADQMLKRRRDIATRYDQAFQDFPFIQRQKVSNEQREYHHAYHLYVVKVPNRKEVYEGLHESRIYSQVHYIPTHLMPYYKKMGWKKGCFPFAENYYEHCLSLPMYPSLTDQEQDFVVEKFLKLVRR